MAITSLNGLFAGARPQRRFIKMTGPTMVVGRMYSSWYVGGMPPAADIPVSGVGGEALVSPVVGQLPFVNPAQGFAYLSNFNVLSNVPGVLLLCDRLWQNSGLSPTLTTLQTVDSVPFPARDENQSINGLGVQIGVEIRVATSTGAPTITLGYTNELGVQGRSSQLAIPSAASSVAGTIYPFAYQGSDDGVRSIQSYTQSVTWTAGSIHLVAYRVIAALPIGAANVPAMIDAVTGGMPKAWPSTVPFFIFVPGTTVAFTWNGGLTWSHG